MSDQPLYIVACTRQKVWGRLPARELYATSDWFTKARDHIEARNAPWLIISARYGLVDPEQEIDPYEQPLEGLSPKGYRELTRLVDDQIRERGLQGHRCVLFAGTHYRELLTPRLKARFGVIDTPLEHLGIGEQKRWFVVHQGERSLQEIEASQEKRLKGAVTILAKAHEALRHLHKYAPPGEQDSNLLLIRQVKSAIRRLQLA